MSGILCTLSRWLAGVDRMDKATIGLVALSIVALILLSAIT